MPSLAELWKLKTADRLSKEKYQTKVEEKKDVWKERATSDTAEVKYAVGVIEAAVEGRRQKALKNVDPNYWAKEAAQGYMSWTPSDEEAQRWEEKAGPYIDAVSRIADEMKRKGLTGPAAAEFWAKEVVPRLAQAKDKPEILPRVVQEALSALPKYMGEQQREYSEILSKAQQLVSKIQKMAGA